MQSIDRPPLLLDEVEFRFGLACGAVVLAMLVAGAFRVPPGATFAAVLILCALLAATLNRPLALVLGMASWALFTGFLTNRYGQLTFARDDLVLMVEFVGPACAASHLARSVVLANDEPRETP